MEIKEFLRYNSLKILPNRLMVGQRFLVPFILVRVQAPQHMSYNISYVERIYTVSKGQSKRIMV